MNYKHCGRYGSQSNHMNLEDPEARDRATKAAGLIKGLTACNRRACQEPLTVGLRWFNTSTRQWYCSSCARRINDPFNNHAGPICFAEGSTLCQQAQQ